LGSFGNYFLRYRQFTRACILTMGCGASVPQELLEDGTQSAVKVSNRAQNLRVTTMQEQEESNSTFGNYVIDTSSLRFSQVEMNTPNTGATAKRFAKSDAVRDLIANTLRGNFIFESLTKHELENLIDVFSPISCVEGDEIIKQGAMGDFMYVVESGFFEVTKSKQGKLSNCGVGQTFGELALLYGAKRSATVTCTQDASLWALDRQTFRYYRASNERRMKDLALDVLAKVPLLNDLELTQLARAAEVARTVDFQEGDVIIRKGEVGHTFYIVLEGVVNCSDASLVDGDLPPIDASRSPRGLPVASEGDGLTPRQMLRQALPAGGVRLKAGDWFGEIALLTGSVRTANVVADSSVRLLAFDRGAFEKVLGSLKDILDRKANNRMLSILPVIARLPTKRREAAVEMFSIEQFADGQTIAAFGDPNPRFLLVKSGTALVWRQPQDPAQPPPELPPAEKKNSTPSETNRGMDSKLETKSETKSETKTLVPSLDIASKGNPRAVRVPESFESSFESLSSFEMVMNNDSNFSHSPSGKRDPNWRSEAAVKTPTIAEEEGKEKDYIELCTGEHVGAEAILNGNPMDCTVVAKGVVTCFMLTRDDLAVLLADEEKDSPTASFESKMGALVGNHPSRVHRGSHIVPPEVDEKEIDWSALKNLGRIGAGTFGTVLMMQDTRDKSTFAMKVLDRKRVKKMRQEKRLETEKQLLKSIKSPFICKFYGDTEDDSAFYLLLELVQGGELQRLIHPAEPEKRAAQQADVESGKLAGIPHQPAKFYTAAISLPLVYLHRREVAFRDLKPENVMIDRFGYPKLIDFGLAKPLDATGGKTYTLCGTPEYLAPEVILGTGHNYAVDWWALGVLLFEMVVGSSPFLEKGVDRRKQDHMVIFENIVENRVDYPVDMESGCKDLVRRLLTGKPAIRMASGRRANKEFEEHLWFAGVVDWHLLNIRQIRPPWFPPIQNPTDQVCFGKVASPPAKT